MHLPGSQGRRGAESGMAGLRRAVPSREFSIGSEPISTWWEPTPSASSTWPCGKDSTTWNSIPGSTHKGLAVTGLSGGGWQTIILSSLDERVAVSVPVAGYSALISRVERPQDTGDIEQNATDLLRGQDYSTLTAMRAPKPTLLIYNAEDECCFRAPLVRPYIYNDVKPFFGLFGKGDHLGWHENTDPSTHNYQLDNRLQAYRHLSRHFGLEPWDREDPVDREIQSYEELVVGLPEDNLTILGVARQSGRQEAEGKRIRRKVGLSKTLRTAGKD